MTQVYSGPCQRLYTKMLKQTIEVQINYVNLILDYGCNIQSAKMYISLQTQALLRAYKTLEIFNEADVYKTTLRLPCITELTSKMALGIVQRNLIAHGDANMQILSAIVYGI